MLVRGREFQVNTQRFGSPWGTSVHWHWTDKPACRIDCFSFCSYGATSVQLNDERDIIAVWREIVWDAEILASMKKWRHYDTLIKASQPCVPDKNLNPTEMGAPTHSCWLGQDWARVGTPVTTHFLFWWKLWRFSNLDFRETLSTQINQTPTSFRAGKATT